ncbi:6-phosphogluconolactonase [Pokkaliibacter sp. CJK22405]|uniref:6-phosphogluconolactonase n=1 Tax=Pokkaliibacter sp. CJK22405 TaxID=3384615 RepID=UPI0039854308
MKIAEHFNGRFNAFDNADALASALSSRIATDLGKSEKPTLAVSGGRTPTLFFQKLSNIELNWSQTSVTLIDERWVPESHKDSNGALVKANLLQSNAAAARFVPMFREGEQSEALAEIRADVAAFPAALDAGVLGMGNDGHTASLFPEASTLPEAMDLNQTERCLFVQPPEAPHLRLTLSRAYIQSANALYLHIQGEDKLATLERALSDNDVMAMPIRAFLDLPQLEIFWCP